MVLPYRCNSGKGRIHRVTYLRQVREDGRVEFRCSNTEDWSHVTYHIINFPSCCKVECHCCKDCFESSTSWKKGFHTRFWSYCQGSTLPEPWVTVVKSLGLTKYIFLKNLAAAEAIKFNNEGSRNWRRQATSVVALFYLKRSLHPGSHLQLFTNKWPPYHGDACNHLHNYWKQPVQFIYSVIWFGLDNWGVHACSGANRVSC